MPSMVSLIAGLQATDITAHLFLTIRLAEIGGLEPHVLRRALLSEQAPLHSGFDFHLCSLIGDASDRPENGQPKLATIVRVGRGDWI